MRIFSNQENSGLVVGLALAIVMWSGLIAPSRALCVTEVANWMTVGRPTGIALDTTGNVYVIEFDNLALRKYTNAGAFITQWTTIGQPNGIAINAAGFVYVSDYTNMLIRIYTASGAVVTSWSNTNPPFGYAFAPYGLAFDASNYLYVAYFSNPKIGKYTSGGMAVLSIYSLTPYAVAVGASGFIYVADQSRNLVSKYTSAGVFVTSWSTIGAAASVAVDASDNVYVVDFSNNLLRKYTTDGVVITSWSTIGEPVSVAVDASNNVYVVDRTNFRIRKYSQTCTSPRSFPAANPSVGVGTKISATNFNNLMSNINYLRTDAGLGVCGWTKGSAPSPARKISATDINDLRACLAGVYTTCNGSCGAAGGCSTFNVSAVGGVSKIRAADIIDLVAGVNNAP